MAYVYQSIDILNNDKTLQTGENQYICGACAIPAYLSILNNDDKNLFDVYSTRPPDNIHTRSTRNKHTIDPRNECRCYLIRCSTATALLVCENPRKYPP